MSSIASTVSAVTPASTISDAIASAVDQLKNAYQPLLTDQVVDPAEQGLIDRALAVLAEAGLTAPLSNGIPALTDNNHVQLAYAVLLNVATRHAAAAEIDASNLQAKVAAVAVDTLTKVASGLIATALASAL